MTDQKRGRRPSSTRPLRAGTSQPVPAGVGVLGSGEEMEPSLGDVSFNDWFESPVFESDPDERLEELATARRGPMRLAASALLRMNARASQVRRRVGEPDPAPGAPGRPGPADAQAPADGEANPGKANGRAAAAANASRTTSSKGSGRAGAAANGSRTTSSKGSGRAGAAASGRPAAGAASTAPASASRPLRARSADPERSGAARPGLTRKKELDTTTAAADPRPDSRPGLRERMNGALDRWAEREALAQTRLERAILPKRWQA